MNNQFDKKNSARIGQQPNLQSGVAAIRQRLNRFRLIDLQRQIQQAIEASYGAWIERFAERGQTLLDETKLHREILPSMLEGASKVNMSDSADLAARLATLLRGCSHGQCSSFANFSPELANLVALFEAAYKSRQNDSHLAFGELGISAAV